MSLSVNLSGGSPNIHLMRGNKIYRGDNRWRLTESRNVENCVARAHDNCFSLQGVNIHNALVAIIRLHHFQSITGRKVFDMSCLVARRCRHLVAILLTRALDGVPSRERDESENQPAGYALFLAPAPARWWIWTKPDSVKYEKPFYNRFFNPGILLLKTGFHITVYAGFWL